VQQQIPEVIISEIIEFVKSHDPGFHLWGRTKENFISDFVYIYCFKLIECDGNQELEHKLHLEGNEYISHNSLDHNLKIMHSIIYTWANNKITPGNEREWNLAAKNRQLPEEFQDINLWIDSSDFPLEKSKETKGWYSPKLKGRAIRVQFLQDAHEIIRFMAGPCDPTQHDGVFLTFNRNEIAQKFKGAKVIGDNHYLEGRRLFTDPVFYVNERESPRDKAVAESSNLPAHGKRTTKKKKIDPNKLTKEEKFLSMKKLERNNTLSHTRGLVEGPFGNLKRKFRVLRERVLQDKDRLYETVVVLASINNMIIVNNQHLCYLN
jgi:hypothetical protein